MRASLALFATAALSGCCGAASVVRPVESTAVLFASEAPVASAAVGGGACAVRDEAERSVFDLAVDDATARFCLRPYGGEDVVTACYAVRLADGRYERLDGERIPQVPDPQAPYVVVGRSGLAVVVQDGTRHPLPSGGGASSADVTADGTLAVLSRDDGTEAPGVPIETYDLVNDNQIAAFAAGDENYQCGFVQLLGRTVYAGLDVCAGPGGASFLHKETGELVARVGGPEFTTWGTVPVPLGGSRWAFLDDRGMSIAVHDVESGALEQTIALTPLWTWNDGAEDAYDGASLGASALARTPSGVLVVVLGGADVSGSVAVVDAARGAVVRAFTPPACPADAR